MMDWPFYGFVEMLMSSPISAHISDASKAQDDRVVPSRLLVAEATLDRLLGLVESDQAPTPALRELMQSGET